MERFYAASISYLVKKKKQKATGLGNRAWRRKAVQRDPELFIMRLGI